jgi:hypothetical protein
MSLHMVFLSLSGSIVYEMLFTLFLADFYCIIIFEPPDSFMGLC